MKIISASIDLKKIDKTKIVNHKNGCAYFNITIIIGDEKNQYEQDTSICISQSKEERERKDKRIYLGNGKTVYDKPKSDTSQTNNSQEGNILDNTNDDLPF